MIIQTKRIVDDEKIIDLLFKNGYHLERYGEGVFTIYQNPIEEKKELVE